MGKIIFKENGLPIQLTGLENVPTKWKMADRIYSDLPDEPIEFIKKLIYIFKENPIKRHQLVLTKEETESTYNKTPQECMEILEGLIMSKIESGSVQNYIETPWIPNHDLNN